MKCSHGSTVLASGGLEGVARLRVNGRQVNQEAQLLRTTAVTLFPRGNRSTLIEFDVQRAFSTQLAADKFVHEHLAEITTQADLVFTLSDNSTTKTYANAVLESCSPVLQGLTVVVSYVFRAALVT